jgi:hypothetical protein
MKKGDLLWLLAFASVCAFLLIPATRQGFVSLTAAHPYAIGFAKFCLLATMGELLALRIKAGDWRRPPGWMARALIWGFLGMVIVLVFEVFASGVAGALAKGLLPGGTQKLAFAFFVSAIMNLTFAPAMMLFHRMTDTWIDLVHEDGGRRVGIARVIRRIDWDGFVSFVLLRTIPCFWIPAHTLTFLLPAEYRVLMAALLSIALGAILAFAKRRGGPAAAAS